MDEFISIKKSGIFAPNRIVASFISKAKYVDKLLVRMISGVAQSMVNFGYCRIWRCCRVESYFKIIF